LVHLQHSAVEVVAVIIIPILQQTTTVDQEVLAAAVLIVHQWVELHLVVQAQQGKVTAAALELIRLELVQVAAAGVEPVVQEELVVLVLAVLLVQVWRQLSQEAQ
jgi:hypothetical protein